VQQRTDKGLGAGGSHDGEKTPGGKNKNRILIRQYQKKVRRKKRRSPKEGDREKAPNIARKKKEESEQKTIIKHIERKVSSFGWGGKKSPAKNRKRVTRT